jgi:hypothetical protein
VAIGSYSTSSQDIVIASEISSRASAADYGVWDGLIGFSLNKFPNEGKSYPF